jgi:hypothetical protein
MVVLALSQTDEMRDWMAPTAWWAPEPRAPTEFGDEVPARKENDD